MALNSAVKLIEAGHLPKAVEQVQRYCSSLDLDVPGCYGLLTKLCHIVSSWNKQHTGTIDLANDLYTLTNILCRSISSTWEVSHLKFMQCLYHIDCYLLKLDSHLAVQLCDYFFLLWSHNERSPLSEDGTLVVANLAHKYLSKMTEERCQLFKLDRDEAELRTWLVFVLRLFELLKWNQMYKLYATLNSILQYFHSQSRVRYQEELVMSLRTLEEALRDQALFSPQLVDVTSFLNIVECAFVFLNESEIIELVEPISGCLKIFANAGSPELEVLCACLETMRSAQLGGSEVAAHFRRFTCSLFSRHRNSNTTALYLVTVLLLKFRKALVSSGVFSDIQLLPVALKLMLELLTYGLKEKETAQKRSKLQMDIVNCALSFISNPSVDILQNVFKYVKVLIKQYNEAVASADFRLANFSIGISAIVTVMRSYKQAELYDSTFRICRYFLLIMLRVNPDALWNDSYLKNYVEFWLHSLVVSCTKLGLGVEAQVMLIVFSSTHPKFAREAMKTWAVVKASKIQSIQMDTTVVDVVRANTEEIEREFPSFVCSSINTDILLLEEVRAYTKIREFQDDAVLGVFKVAAKVCGDIIALGNVLCCTVDALTLNVDLSAYSMQLATSVHNAVDYLQKCEKGIKEVECEEAVLFVTLGNLFYAKARLELRGIRQAALVTLQEESEWENRKRIPVFRGGDVDDLDVTEVMPSNGNYKMDRHLEPMAALGLALDYWAQAEATVSQHYVMSPTFSFMKGAGYLLRLYSYRTMETHCWQLLYKMAGKLKTEKYQFIAAAELLTICKAVDAATIQAMDKLAKDTKRINQKCYSHHLYLVNRAKNLFLRGKGSECREALGLVKVTRALPFYLVNVQFKTLSALVDIVHPVSSTTASEAPLTRIVDELSQISYLIKNKQWASRCFNKVLALELKSTVLSEFTGTFNEATVVELILLELASYLGSAYADMMYVRQARCYTKTALKLAQVLSLPFRVCQLKSLRCIVDLLTWNLLETNINSQELESTLELVASESFRVKCVPHFLSTNEACECQYCTELDYYQLVLQAITTRIQIAIGNENYGEAQQVINVGLSVVDVARLKATSANFLWTSLSSAMGRFYTVVASANLLWSHFTEAERYGVLARKSEELSNPVVSQVIKHMFFNINWARTYPLVVVAKPASRRFKSTNITTDGLATTPEAPMRSDTEPCVSKVGPRTRKPIDPDYIDKRPLFHRKNLGFDPKEGDASSELDGVSALSKTPVIERESASRGVVYHEIKAKVKSELFACAKMDQLETPTREGKSAAVFPAHGDQSTPCRTPAVTEARTRQDKLDRKVKITNDLPKFFTTPAIKVFYDPDGIESTSKRRVVGKKALKVAGATQCQPKVGTQTPKLTTRHAMSSRRGKGKLVFDFFSPAVKEKDVECSSAASASGTDIAATDIVTSKRRPGRNNYPDAGTIAPRTALAVKSAPRQLPRRAAAAKELVTNLEASDHSEQSKPLLVTLSDDNSDVELTTRTNRKLREKKKPSAWDRRHTAAASPSPTAHSSDSECSIVETTPPSSHGRRVVSLVQDKLNRVNLNN